MKFPPGEVMRTIRSAILVFAALGWNAPAQDAPPDSPPIRVDVDVVNILCTVRDQRGALVTDLKQEDFMVFENGKPQQIRYFARETNLPLTLALLLDLSGSVPRLADLEKNTPSRVLVA